MFTLSKNSQKQHSRHFMVEPGTLFNVRDVSVSFGKIKALKNVQLTVKDGEILFLTGPSGAGKTTLLRVLAGDIEVDRGQVLSKSNKLFLSRVFQDLRLLNELSIYENLLLAFDNEVYQSKKDFEIDLKELARILDFQDKLELKVENINGGLKQKVAIIRALLSRPDVFIADEPTCSMDIQNARKVFELLNLYNMKRGMTVIWASHNKELVKQFTGRIVHIDNGKIIYTGHACFI